MVEEEEDKRSGSAVQCSVVKCGASQWFACRSMSRCVVCCCVWCVVSRCDMLCNGVYSVILGGVVLGYSEHC